MATKKGEKLLYEDLTYQIRGACFNVWKEFGGAFKEKVVDRALTEELKGRGLEVESQKAIDIYYKGKKIAIYTPDKIVNNSILLEIKCKPFLTKEDERQFWYYLKGSNYRLGLLINFGSKKLEIKRRIYDKARAKYIRVDPRSYLRQSASTQKGFTIIELIVVISIITILSAIVLVSYRTGERQLMLQRAASKLAQDIRRAQEMAMSARECTPPPVSCPAGGGVPVGGYGLYIDKSQPDRYFIYADSNTSPGAEQYSSGEEIETIFLEKEVKIEDLVPASANFSINFRPPDPTIKMKDAAGIDKENVTIIIALIVNPSQTKTIKVNKAGRIEIH